MVRSNGKDPPNGVARAARYIITLTSAAGFGALITTEFVFGYIYKPVPMWLYFLLAGISLFSSDRLYTLLEAYINWLTLRKDR